MLTLRPYQLEANAAVISEWYDKGVQATIVSMSTGTGKTETFLSVLDTENQAGRLDRALVLAHRQELIFQPVERVERNWPQLPRPGIVMAQHNDVDRQIVIATVQTLNSERRMDALLAHGAFSHLIVDEVHHATAKTYLDTIERLQEANPALKILGATATPKRTDGDGLSRVFESVAYRIGIKDAIVKWKALCPFTAIAAQLPVDISSVRIRGGDWDEGELGNVLSAKNAEEIIIETWKRQAHSRPTMAFTASVAQAQSLANAFNEAGISAAFASGETHRDERKRIIQGYQSGDYQILVNCQLFTEGFDVPKTSCVLMAKPTRSDLVYIQSVGRGLRLYPGKTDCLILDFVPLNARDMRMAGDLLGKPKEQRKAEAKAEDRGVILDCFGILSDGTGIDGDPDAVQMRVLDFFNQNPLAWTFDGGIATVGIKESLSVAVVLPQPQRVENALRLKAEGQWNPKWDELLKKIGAYQVYVINGRAQHLGTFDDWERASLEAEAYWEQHGDSSLSKRNQYWRSQPASDKQRNYAQQIGAWRDGMSRGECAQAITHKLALQTLKRAGAA